jgi:hypothetical protein
MTVKIHRYVNDSMDNATAYMFEQLFSQEELDEGKWFLTASYDREMIESVVADLTGGSRPDLVRSHPDTEDVFFYAVVPNLG